MDKSMKTWNPYLMGRNISVTNGPITSINQLFNYANRYYVRADGQTTHGIYLEKLYPNYSRYLMDIHTEVTYQIEDWLLQNVNIQHYIIGANLVDRYIIMFKDIDPVAKLAAAIPQMCVLARLKAQ